MSHIRKVLKSIITFSQADNAREQLKRLRVKAELNQSTIDDLREWESNLEIIRKSQPFYETTKLLNEKLSNEFLRYLEKHYPGDKLYW